MSVCKRKPRRGGGRRKGEGVANEEEGDSAECGVPGQLRKNKSLTVVQKMRRFREHWYSIFEENARALRALSQSDAPEVDLVESLNKLLALYSTFIESKLVYAGEDPVFIAAGGGCSALEGAFMWVGGWRPSSAIALAFTVMGVDPAAAMLPSRDACITLLGSADLTSAEQTTIARLKSFHSTTEAREKQLSSRMATFQMTGSDNFVETFKACPTALAKSDVNEIRNALLPQLVSLTDLLAEAEHLRLTTARKLMQLLSPSQGVKWVLIAFELIFAVRKLGLDCYKSPEIQKPLLDYNNLQPGGGVDNSLLQA
ncbi:unnamed protein product [Calypogeia fissa]